MCFFKRSTSPKEVTQAGQKINFDTKVANVFTEEDRKKLANTMNDIINCLKTKNSSLNYIETLLQNKDIRFSTYKKSLENLAKEYSQSKEGKKKK
jgi:hypothetical protein